MGKNKKKPLLPKSTLIIRLIAGAYLIYLAFELITSLNVENGAPVWVSVLAALAFAVVGIILAFCSGKDFLKGNFQGGIMDVSGKEIKEEKSSLENVVENEDVSSS